jgi:L-alanine-DL-glutamate epimerase-like enolase superfamily enzyme
MSTRLRRVQARVFRHPLATPVLTSFGVMDARPALFVRVEDEEGAVGVGEVWCNFPACGAEHRARLVDTLFAPLLDGRDVADPRAVFAALTERTAVLALQSGEPGPVQQCIAGIDIALWDLAARRAGEPLWRVLAAQPHGAQHADDGTSGSRPDRVTAPPRRDGAPSAARSAVRVPVYASGLNPDHPEALAARCREAGHRAFKLKVGFGEARDLANVRAMRDTLGDVPLMADANQAWDFATAQHMSTALAPFALGWLEEPLRADRPWHEWQALAKIAPMPLAGGENVAGEDNFAQALAARAWRVVQPDVAKWGGLSGCLAVAHAIRAAGERYCPHYLGGGLGLLASAHLLAAVGGDGLLEVDANPNPLRDLASGNAGVVRDGHVTLDAAPGLGDVLDWRALEPFAVRH